MNIIFHVNEPERFSMALNNIHNLLAIDSDIKMELLIHGKAITQLLISELAKSERLVELDKLYDQNVVFAVCNNTLSQMKITKNQVYHHAVIVAAGVYELAHKQQQGYCYIKP